MKEEEQSSSRSQKSQKVIENPSTTIKACVDDIKPVKQTLIDQELEILQPNKSPTPG